MKTVAVLLSLVFVVTFLALPLAFGQESFDPKLFEGPWAGTWISDKAHRDKAPMLALIQVDLNARVPTASIIMFQVPKPPAPEFSSLSIGRIENGKIVIDAASSGIGGGGSEMTFWLESPLLLKGTYKNEFDSGTFEFKRTSGRGA